MQKRLDGDALDALALQAKTDPEARERLRERMGPPIGELVRRYRRLLTGKDAYAVVSLAVLGTAVEHYDRSVGHFLTFAFTIGKRALWRAEERQRKAATIPLDDAGPVATPTPWRADRARESSEGALALLKPDDAEWLRHWAGMDLAERRAAYPPGPLKTQQNRSSELRHELRAKGATFDPIDHDPTELQRDGATGPAPNPDEDEREPDPYEFEDPRYFELAEANGIRSLVLPAIAPADYSWRAPATRCRVCGVVVAECSIGRAESWPIDDVAHSENCAEGDVPLFSRLPRADRAVGTQRVIVRICPPGSARSGSVRRPRIYKLTPIDPAALGIHIPDAINRAWDYWAFGRRIHYQPQVVIPGVTSLRGEEYWSPDSYLA